MGDSIKLGRIWGIEVGLNWSVLIAVWLVAWSLASAALPTEYPGHTTTAYWVAGVISAALFYGSLLGHELAHSFVARRLGVPVEGITLWLFGGVSRMREEATKPRTEILITVVGPLASLALALIFAILALVLPALRLPALVTGIASWLAGANALLGVFNLVPAFPLDGGRILRAVLWARRGDMAQATTTAANVGVGFGILMIVAGLIEFLFVAAEGLWLVFLGWFLLSAARDEASSVLLRTALRGVRVRDVMTPTPTLAPDWITVDAFLTDYVLTHKFTTFPTRDFDSKLSGMVTLAQLKQVPADKRAELRVRDIALPLAGVPRATPDEQLVELLQRLAMHQGNRALVMDGDTLAGIVTPTDVSRALTMQGLVKKKA